MAWARGGYIKRKKKKRGKSNSLLRFSAMLCLIHQGISHIPTTKSLLYRADLLQTKQKKGNHLNKFLFLAHFRRLQKGPSEAEGDGPAADAGKKPTENRAESGRGDGEKAHAKELPLISGIGGGGGGGGRWPEKKRGGKQLPFFIAARGGRGEKGSGWGGWIGPTSIAVWTPCVVPHSCPGVPHARQPNRGRNFLLPPTSSRGARPTFFRSLYSSSDPTKFFLPDVMDGGNRVNCVDASRRRTFSEQTGGVGGGNFFLGGVRIVRLSGRRKRIGYAHASRPLLYSFLPLDILSILTLGPSTPTSVVGTRKEQKYDQKSTKSKKFFLYVGRGVQLRNCPSFVYKPPQRD